MCKSKSNYSTSSSMIFRHQWQWQIQHNCNRCTHTSHVCYFILFCDLLNQLCWYLSLKQCNGCLNIQCCAKLFGVPCFIECTYGFLYLWQLLSLWPVTHNVYDLFSLLILTKIELCYVSLTFASILCKPSPRILLKVRDEIADRVLPWLLKPLFLTNIWKFYII